MEQDPDQTQELYKSSLERLSRIASGIDGIDYLHVFQVREDGFHILFSLEPMGTTSPPAWSSPWRSATRGC